MYAGYPLLAARGVVASDAAGALFSALGSTGSTRKPGWGLWARGYGSMGNRRGNDISTKYDYDLAGIVAGFDGKIGDSLLAGASVGCSHSKTTMKDLSDTGRVSGHQGSLYEAYRRGPWHVRGIMAYGYNRYDTSRDVSFGAIARTASASYSGRALGAHLETGRRIVTPHVDIIPVASIEGAYLARDSFRETGAGALDLDVDRDRASSLLSSLGVRLRKQYKAPSGTITPEVKALWLHEFATDDYTVSAIFSGSPLSTFTIRGDRPDRNSANAGLTLTWETEKGMGLCLSYDAILSGDHTEHGGSLGVKYRW
jgi:outer membrane autotransporter protein